MKGKKERNCEKSDSEQKSHGGALAWAGIIFRNILVFKKLID